jgi:hypothetical protein
MMPQHVKIQIDNGTVEELMTSNCGPGNYYRIKWQDEWLGKFDTGVATQQDATDPSADSICDFTHARRGLAAVGVAATAVIGKLIPETEPFQTAEIKLRTNGHERGRVLIRANDDDTLSVKIQIGTSGDSRYHPDRIFVHGPVTVLRPEAQSRLEVVFRVLASEYTEWLAMLAKRKLPGSALP